MSQGSVGSACRLEEDSFCTAAVWTWRLAPIVFSVLGVVGNIFNIAILLRKNLRSKPCFILVFLSVSDLIVVISVFVLDCLRKGYGVELPHIVCLSAHFFKYGFGTFSLWTVAIFTIERLAFVVFPHQSNKHLTQFKTLTALFGVLFMSITIFGLMFFTPSTTIKQRIGNESSKEFDLRPNQSTIQTTMDRRYTNGPENLEFAEERITSLNGSIEESMANIQNKSIAKLSSTTEAFASDQMLDISTQDRSTQNGSIENGLNPEDSSLDRTQTEIYKTNNTQTGEKDKAAQLNIPSERNKDLDHEMQSDKNPDHNSNGSNLVTEHDNSHQNTHLHDNSFDTAHESAFEVPNRVPNGPLDADKLSFTNMENCWRFAFEEGSFQHMLRATCLFTSLIIPSMIIVLGNTCLVYELYKRKAHTESSDSQTTTLFAISGILLTTLIPWGVIAALGIIFKDETDLTTSYMALISSIAECFTTCNFTLNFYCYFWKSSLFKEECKAMWRELKAALCH